MGCLLGGVVKGAAAGAAGTTALNTVGYLDMVLRARSASSTPEATVEALSDALHVPVPGDGERRAHRVTALGALSGIAAGVGMGALLGAARAAGFRPGAAATCGAAGLLALIGTNGPMTALKVTDPRTWSGTDWIADIVPHLAYAGVTAALLDRLEP